MSVRKLIKVHDQNPLQTVREFLGSVWNHAQLDGLFLPVWQDGEPPLSTLINSPDLLERADPFAPVMHHNSACMAVETIRKFPQKKFGFMLRPCELRSFNILTQKMNADPVGQLLISSDCLATFPPEDFDWRLDSSPSPENLTQSALHFAAQGGLLPSRYRNCCQFCDKPFPEHADITIELLGIATQQHLVISLESAEIVNLIGMEQVKGQTVPNEVNLRREKTLKRLADWRQQAQAYASAHISQEQKTVASLVEHLIACPYCRDVIHTQCPLFESEWMTLETKPDPDKIQTWLESCGGCGMCETDCPEGYPLFQSILFISKTISSR
jgi:formate dehydrogenase subunit beta